MLAILTLLVVLCLSLLVTRVATILLIHTGMSREVARFQARSAFSGAGFTTGESEQVVNHPVRRRIVFTLILLGNAGLVTAVSSLILTFVGGAEGGMPLWAKIAFLVGGLILLLALARSPIVDRALGRAVTWAIRRYTDLEVRDFDSLLHLAEDYRVVELLVEESDWIAERHLEELRLRDEGVVVLGILRADGSYVGVPRGRACIHAGDTLICYGRAAAIEAVDRRRTGVIGDVLHERAVGEQRAVEEREAAAEEEGGGEAGGAAAEAGPTG